MTDELRHILTYAPSYKQKHIRETETLKRIFTLTHHWLKGKCNVDKRCCYAQLNVYSTTPLSGTADIDLSSHLGTLAGLSLVIRTFTFILQAPPFSAWSLLATPTLSLYPSPYSQQFILATLTTRILPNITIQYTTSPYTTQNSMHYY